MMLTARDAATATELKKLDPRLGDKRELVEELRKDPLFENLSHEAILAVADRVKTAKGPDKPARDEFPGGSATDRVLSDGRSVPEGINPEKLTELEKMLGSKLTPDEIEYHKRTGALK